MTLNFQGLLNYYARDRHINQLSSLIVIKLINEGYSTQLFLE